VEHVFINCPFDDEYQPLFRALVFAVMDCGFFPRCALERDDGSETRIEKIRRIIGESDFGLHDISRTELDVVNGLPRFNMPLELGIYLGARYFGRPHGGMACVIFDRERYRHQKFCSDLAGHDIRAHGGEEHAVIRGVRDAARTWVPRRALPGAGVMSARYTRFVTALPVLAGPLDLDPDGLTFADLVTVAGEWMRLNQPSAPAS
jgi:hypothetical protein